MMCSSTVRTECIVVCMHQQWLCECATMLCYTCIVYHIALKVYTFTSMNENLCTCLEDSLL